MSQTISMIELRNLSHAYGKFQAVKNLNLTVHEGEIFGFLGPNGAGKSTTINMMMDFIRPTQGSVRLFEADARKDGVAIRKRIGYLPAELTLWENWTGFGYLRWLEQMRGASFLPEAQRIAELLQFDLKRSLRGMSTGMKRKIGLIATLAPKPPLLVLDEPTIGLDPLMQQVFDDLMLEAKREGRTVFLSSHNLQEVERICDRVGIISKGELQTVETVQALTKLTFRWLTLKVEGDAHMNGFGKIRGVSQLQAQGHDIRMRVAGDADINHIIKEAAHFEIHDLRLEEPSLEEIFLTYYGHASAEQIAQSSVSSVASK